MYINFLTLFLTNNSRTVSRNRIIMDIKIIICLVFVITIAKGHRRYHHGYRNYNGYGNKYNVYKPVVDPVPQVNICPQLYCPAFIPPECRKPTFTNVYGVVCKGCDENVCQKKTEDKHVDTNANLGGPDRGDIPKVPKFLNQINGGSWIDSTLDPKPVFVPNIPATSNNGIYIQNNVPVWQNAPINGQFQNSLVQNGQLSGNPNIIQWQDNVRNTAQFQGTLPGQNLLLPTFNQWQNKLPINNNNMLPVANQIPIGNNQMVFPVNNQIQPGSVTFPSNNQLWSGTSTGNQQLGSVSDNIVGTRAASEPWESGQFQGVNSWITLQNPQNSFIPQDSSLPVFNNEQSIPGISSISGLPMQIGKSADSVPIRVESDKKLDSESGGKSGNALPTLVESEQNFGFTNTLYKNLPLFPGTDVKTKVYEENSPNSQKTDAKQ